MSFLGIGPFELLLLLVIATVVLGPERMAQAGRTLGRLYARYRLRWQKDVDEMTRELRRELALLQQEVDQIKQTAESEIKTAQTALEQAVSADIDVAPATDTTDTASTRTDGEQERPQVADASGQEPGSSPPLTGIDEV